MPAVDQAPDGSSSESSAPARPTTFDVAVLCRFADLAVEGLGAAREEIDALNVYPVPDGDTGTNMFLTVEAARDAMADRLGTRGADPGGDLGTDLGGALAAYTRGALLGARGSSGVILSQLIGALMRRIAAASPHERAAVVFADGMRLAADAAWAAVGTPVEGTILSVARAAAEAAAQVAREPGVRLERVVHGAADAARAAVARTPDQMRLLRESGVVDAGGRGLCVVLDAAESAVSGRTTVPAAVPMGTHHVPVPTYADDPAARHPGAEGRPADDRGAHDLSADGPAYEVMYLLDAEETAIPELRDVLAALGDSLVVVGGDGLWNVHVHVDDVGAAVEAGIRAGTPRRIRVTHFAEQVTRAREQRQGRALVRAVVAVAEGPGLGRLFEGAGAHVVEATPGRRPSTAQVLAAIRASGATEVIVLPNDPDSQQACQAAAHEAAALEVKVVVVPTAAQVQGIAALAVHEPGRPLEEDVVAMTSAARHARHGAVTVASRQAMTSAGPCEPGDVLGAIEGDFVAIGHDLGDVARGVLARLLDNGGELVTIVAGEDAEALAAEVAAYVEDEHPGVDVSLYAGGQERYPLLLAVE